MITVLGLGFVGLTTALGFSKKGFKVYGIDTNEAKINSLKNYQLPFYEPHLDVALREELGENFFIDVSLKESINNSQIIFLCVGTPENEDGSAYLGFLLDAIKEIFEYSDDRRKTIVIKSTVPPSTISKKIKPVVDALNCDKVRNFGLASNPEFLREGYAWDDFINPDRIVIGVEDDHSKTMLREIYSPFQAPIHFVYFNSAEYIKYLSNTFLSTLISYSNEMAMLADHIGNIDVPTAFKILHQDKRWFGNPANISSYVYPGCGYGGYCLPKDTAALDSVAREHGYQPKMLEANLEVNKKIKEHVVNKITTDVNKNQLIGVLGLSFKSGSDDVRLSPSKFIIENLLEKGFSNVIAFDPLANSSFKKEYNLPIDYACSLEEIVKKADVLVLLTNWPEFKLQKKLITSKRFFDCRYEFFELQNSASSVTVPVS